MRLLALAAVVLSVTGCRKKEPGVASVNDAPALIDRALQLGATTWPGSTVSDVMIDFEWPFWVKHVSDDEVYVVGVTFAFAPKPDGVRSGSVRCSPDCRVLPRPSKQSYGRAHTFPCSFADALAAARRAGLTVDQPFVTLGGWNGAGHEDAWLFRATRAAPAIEVGAGCVAKPPPS